MSEESEIKSNTRPSHTYNNLDPNSKNWPPCKPLFRQDIKTDIPQELRMIVRIMLYHWFYTAIFLLFNFITALASIFVDFNDYFGTLIGAIVWLVAWTPLCFMFYRFLYKAAWKRKSFHYMVFLCGDVAQIIMSVFAATGISSSGLMGFIQMADLLKTNSAVGFMCLVNAIGFILNVIFLVVIFIKLRIAFKEAGGVKAAKEQAVEGAVEVAVDTAKENPELVASV